VTKNKTQERKENKGRRERKGGKRKREKGNKKKRYPLSIWTDQMYSGAIACIK